MRRLLDDGAREFATIMWFDDLDAVRAFAGEDHEVSHVPDAARAVLARFDERAAHFEVLDQRVQPLADLAPSLPQLAGLLVIDVQAGFDDPEWGPRNNPDAEANIGRLLDVWRASDRPVFHVRHISTSAEGHFRAGSRGQAIKLVAAPLSHEPVYPKQVNSAFIGTDLERDLRAGGVETLVVVGLTTNHCVSTSARMAANLGFRTLVVADATAAFAQSGWDGRARSAEEVHGGALGDLSGEFAEIVDTAALIRAAAGGA